MSEVWEACPNLGHAAEVFTVLSFYLFVSGIFQINQLIQTQGTVQSVFRSVASLYETLSVCLSVYIN